MRAEIINKAREFIYALEEARPFFPEYSKERWLGRFTVPLFYSYLKYWQHLGEPTSEEEIRSTTIALIRDQYEQEVADYFISLLDPLAEEYANDTSAIQESVLQANDDSVDFSSIYIMYLLKVFHADADSEGTTKLIEILIDVSESQPSNDDSFHLTPQQIATWVSQFVSDMQEVVLTMGRGHFQKRDAEVKSITVGFATYLATMCANRNLSAELFSSSGNDRSYITEEALYESLRFNCHDDELLSWCRGGLRFAYQYDEEGIDLTKLCIYFLLGIMEKNCDKNLMIKIVQAMVTCVGNYTFNLEKNKTTGEYEIGTTVSWQHTLFMNRLQ